MSENNSKKKSKKVKKNIKCKRCEFYDSPIDYCSEKDIEDCSKQAHINFSSCQDYLIREDLVMF